MGKGPTGRERGGSMEDEREESSEQRPGEESKEKGSKR
jgi:hypothetical protein